MHGEFPERRKPDVEHGALVAAGVERVQGDDFRSGGGVEAVGPLAAPAGAPFQVFGDRFRLFFVDAAGVVGQRRDRGFVRTGVFQAAADAPDLQHRRGVRAEEAGLHRQLIQHREIVGIVGALDGAEERRQARLAAKPADAHVLQAMHVDARQGLCHAAVREHGGRQRRHGAVRAGEDQDVPVVGDVHDVVVELAAQGIQRGGHGRGVDLVELQPLQHQAARREVALDLPVELDGEQAGNAADPGIGGFGDDQVVLPLAAREVGLGILDVDPAARIVEGQVREFSEQARSLDHRALDLDGFDLGHARIEQQRMGGAARAHADDGHLPGIRAGHQRQRRAEDLGVFVGGRRTADKSGRIRLAVGQDRHGAVDVPRHVDGGALAVAVKQDLGADARHAEAIHARRGPGGIEWNEGGDAGREQQAARQRQCRGGPGDAAEARQQPQAQRQVHRGAGDDDLAQAQQRHHQLHRRQHSGDAAERVHRIDPADGGLAAAVAQQGVGDQGQGGAGEEGHRQHQRQADCLRGEVEDDVAGFIALQGLEQRRHPVEGVSVQRDGEERRAAHGDLDPAEQAQRCGLALDAVADVEAAGGEAEDESRQHQLEGVGGRAQHQGQHAQPADLVEERGRAGEEGRRQEQGRRRRGGRARGGGRRGLAPGTGAPPQQPYAGGQHEIDQAGGHDRTRQPRCRDQAVAADQHADGRTEAVGEVQPGQGPARRGGAEPHQPGADQGKGGAKQHRLRQHDQAAQAPLDQVDSQRRIEPRDEGVEHQRLHGAEDVIEDQGGDSQRGLDGAVGEQGLPAARAAAADQPGPQGHAAHEDHQHQGLGIGRMPQEQLQVVRPDRFVDQAGEAGQREQDIQGIAKTGYGSHVWHSER